MSDGRELVLARIRNAARSPPATLLPESYRRRGEAPAGDLVARFAERAAEYGAHLTFTSGEPADALAAVCRSRGLDRLAVPGDLPDAWRPRGVEFVPEAGLDARGLDDVGASLTGCELAIAETGTLVLAAGARQGRRLLTLVPDVHVCVVESGCIVADVPDAVAQLAGTAGMRPVTLVSGPSATSDIEFVRVEGVHGPRVLELVLLAAGR